MNLRNSGNIKIIQEQYDVEEPVDENSEMKKSKETGIFPKIHAETVVIPDMTENLHFDSAEPHSGVQDSSAYESRKRVISKKACEDLKRNLETDIKLSDEFHKMKVDLVQSQMRIKKLGAENTELKAELDARTNEVLELMAAFDEERNHNAELQEHIILMEQQISDPTQLQLLRGQVLENAKMEMAQLRLQVQEKNKRIMELEMAASMREADQRLEGSSMLKQMHELCAEVQKYKLLLAATTRQAQEQQVVFNVKQQANKDIEEQLCLQNKEIAKGITELEVEKQILEAATKEDKVVIRELRETIVEMKGKYEELKEKYEKAFNELNEAKEEIEQFGKIEKHEDLAIGYSEQITQIKEQFNKKLQTVNEELIKYKEEVKRKDNQIVEYEKKLQEDPLMDLVGEPNEGIIEEIEKILEVKEGESIQEKIEELLADAEEAKLIKEQLQEMEDTLNESQRFINKLKGEVEQEKVKYKDLEASIENLKNQNEILSESKEAMQIQLDNLNEILNLKEKEINILAQSRNVAEENEKAICKETEETIQEWHRLIKEIVESLTFSFIDIECPIDSLMSKEEILNKSNEFLLYLNTLKEHVEGMKRKIDETKIKDTTLNKDEKKLNEERVHNEKILKDMEDIEERHKIEIEAISSSKEIIVTQLQEKLNQVTEKLARKKEKVVNLMTYNEELLNKQKELIIEKQEIQDKAIISIEDYRDQIKKIKEEHKLFKNSKSTEELLNENEALKAECKRLKGLCDEAKADMKRMVNTSLKLNTRDINNSTSSNKSHSKCEVEQLLMQHEDEIAKLHSYINDLLQTFDLNNEHPLLPKTLSEHTKKVIGKKCMNEQNDTLSKENSLQINVGQSLERKEVKMSLDEVLQEKNTSQQFNTEMDIINYENPYYSTTRTMSFGVPEALNESSNLKEVLEEYKRKVEQEKSDEYDKMVQKLKENYTQEIKRTNIAMNTSQEKWQNKEKYYEETIEMLKKENLELMTKFEDDKNKELEKLIKFKEEEIKSNLNIENLKALNAKREELKKQYMETRDKLLEDFETLKEKLYKEVEEKTARIDKEYQELIQENTNKNEETERKYKERIGEKEQLMDSIMKMRIKEIEEDHKIQLEKLEYNLKYEAQCQAEKQRAEFAQERKEFEERYRNKVEELETKLRTLMSEGRKKEEQLKDELKKLKEEEERKCDQTKKKVEKEFMIKVEQLQKKLKESEDKMHKLKREYEEDNKKQLEEKEIALEALTKKHKDEMKVQKERHRVEIRNIKESHKNELIKKNIEKERELKKLNDIHAEELEKLNKETEERKPIIKPINGIFYNINA